ncbi:MAG: hypothetical protein JSV89_21335 [Spirochaetaceae bacterium]|nr:MAG: hypothetical protein JSV89_21335 [Spirochaetaceae bacterium]
MLQFYFLSIFANILAGLTLTSDYFAEKFKGFLPFQELFSKNNVKTTIGIFAFVVGFLKLLIRSNPADVPVVGDLLPALAGLVMGAGLILGIIRERGTVSAEKVDNLEKTVMTYRVPLGIAGLVIGALHFLVPGALFL